VDKSKLRIVVIDDSITSLHYIQLMLKKAGIEDIITFEDPLKALDFIKTEKVDIVFIDYFMPELNGVEVLRKIKAIDNTILTVIMTNSSDEDVKIEAIKEGVNEFLQKNINFPDFMAKVNILINLRLYYYQIKSYQESLEETLKYKDNQEEMTVRKQYKIIEDYVSNHFYGNWIADSYFKPYDIVSGDSYNTLRINDHTFFVAIVDGMGKGVSASLTSVLTIAFLNHSISKSAQFDDYNFERAVKDTFEYVKSILLEDEALSFAMVEINIKDEKIKYVNFGLPPFYIKRDEEMIKIKPNNFALLLTKKEFQIDEIHNFDALLVASDGLNESVMNDGYPYFIRLKEIFKNSFLLSEIVKDFNKNVETADDDMTVFLLTKDKNSYETIYSKKLLINKKEIEDFVNNIEFKLPQDKLSIKIISKIVLVLNELLLNSLEHSAMKMGTNKQEIVKNDIKIEYNNKNSYVDIKIKITDGFVTVEVEDDGDGFEINDILKKEWFDRFHGRGIKMLKSLSNGIYYNSKGNKVKIYLKEK